MSVISALGKCREEAQEFKVTQNKTLSQKEKEDKVTPYGNLPALVYSKSFIIETQTR